MKGIATAPIVFSSLALIACQNADDVVFLIRSGAVY